MKIVLADSNELIRLGIRSAIKNDTGVEIVAEALSSEELQDVLRTFEVDLVVIDYTAKGFSIDVLHQLAKLNKTACIKPTVLGTPGTPNKRVYVDTQIR